MASGTHQWVRNGGFFLSNTGHPAPLTQNAELLNTGPVGSSLLRVRLDFRMYVSVEGSGGGFAEHWWQDVLAQVGVWWDSSAAAPSTSPTPITNPDPTPDWVINNTLYPHMDVYDVATPYEEVSWTSSTGTIDVFSKRRASSTQVNTLWLAWELNDPSSLINTTSGAFFYGLGCWWWFNALYELH